MQNILSEAVLNNARWCDAMCRLHGLEGRSRAGWWSVPRRPPTFYPDAVTLEPGASAASILGSVDASAGCAVKDSYADLDLSPFGFRVLFEARWIARDPGPTSTSRAGGKPRWTEVNDADHLISWERAWADDEPPSGLFRAGLLDDPDVAMIAGVREGAIVAGAIAFRTASVIALTNVFTMEGELDATWRACSAVASNRFPGHPLVGYERGPALDVAERQGFRQIGPLRVWYKPDPA